MRRCTIWVAMLAVFFYTVAPACASLLMPRGGTARTAAAGHTCACHMDPQAPGGCCCSHGTAVKGSCGMGTLPCSGGATPEAGLWTAGNPLAIFRDVPAVAPTAPPSTRRSLLAATPTRLAFDLPTPPPQR